MESTGHVSRNAVVGRESLRHHAYQKTCPRKTRIKLISITVRAMCVWTPECVTLSFYMLLEPYVFARD